MNEKPKSPPFDDLNFPAADNPNAELEAWQKAKIKAGLKDADEGRFATPDAVKAVIRKFVPNG